MADENRFRRRIRIVTRTARVSDERARTRTNCTVRGLIDCCLARVIYYIPGILDLSIAISSSERRPARPRSSVSRLFLCLASLLTNILHRPRYPSTQPSLSLSPLLAFRLSFSACPPAADNSVNPIYRVKQISPASADQRSSRRRFQFPEKSIIVWHT